MDVNCLRHRPSGATTLLSCFYVIWNAESPLLKPLAPKRVEGLVCIHEYRTTLYELGRVPIVYSIELWDVVKSLHSQGRATMFGIVVDRTLVNPNFV